MRKIVWALAATGLVATAACGQADKGNTTTTTSSTTTMTSAAEPAFNAGLCQSVLNAKAGANVTVPPGGCLISPGKTYAMIMMTSGELKVAPLSGGTTPGATIWSSSTHATSPGSSSTAFQEDGNLVIYDQPGNKPTWASGSAGPLGPYRLTLSDGGELIAASDTTGKTLWSSKTGLVKPGSAPAAVDATPANATT